MKKDRIINHLKHMKEAINRGDTNEFILLLDTLVVKTRPIKELIELEGYSIKISNDNGLSINIIKNNKYVKYIKDYNVITNNGVQDKQKSFQDIIDDTFYSQLELLFKDMENDMDGNTTESE